MDCGDESDEQRVCAKNYLGIERCIRRNGYVAKREHEDVLSGTRGGPVVRIGFLVIERRDTGTSRDDELYRYHGDKRRRVVLSSESATVNALAVRLSLFRAAFPEIK